VYVIRYKDTLDILQYQQLSGDERKRREVAFKHLIKEEADEAEKKAADKGKEASTWVARDRRLAAAAAQAAGASTSARAAGYEETVELILSSKAAARQG